MKKGNEDLGLLVSLLNASSAAQFQEELHRQLGKEYADVLGFDDKWVKKAWLLQDKLLKDIGRLFDTKAKATVEKHLHALIEKVNSLNFKPYWRLWPGQRFIGGEYGNNPAYKRLGHHQGIVKIGRGKWIVTVNFRTLESPKDFFYGAIIETLQSGQLKHLKRCQWGECRNFFITYDLRRTTYCRTQCMLASDRADAAKRVQKSRNQRK